MSRECEFVADAIKWFVGGCASGAILFALWLTAPASAQSVITIRGTSPTSYVLDGQPAPTRAYSLRRLLTSYSTNKLINIVRASDSTTTDIGFDATGALDIATASTFCNATTCKVVTLYDQSGNTANMTQGTDANRPPLAFTCLGSYACFQTTAATMLLAAAGNVTPATGLVSHSTVAKRSTGTGVCGFQPTGSAANNSMGPAGANLWRLAASGTFIIATATDNAWYSGQAVAASGASASTLSINGTETAGTVTVNVTAGAPRVIGAGGTTTCNMEEMIFWDNIGLTATQRAMLTNNQRAWWGF